MGVLKVPDGVDWRVVGCPTSPLVPQLAEGWRYLQVPTTDTSTSYAGTSYDDSAWSTGQAKFGTPGSEAGINTAWSVSNLLWIRRHVPAASDYTVTVWVDDEADVYWNGTFVATADLTSGYPSTPIPIPIGLITTGQQLLAVRGKDLHGGNVKLSVQVTSTSAQGLFKLWDGTQWFREKCASEGGLNVLPGLSNGTLNPTLPTNLYNGNRGVGDYYNLGPGTVSATVDLGAATAIERVNWLLYYGDTRTYLNLRLEGSPDNSTWTTIRPAANFQPSTTGAAGLDITVGGTYRYLRFHAEGNVSFNSNDWIELEVWDVGVSGHPLMMWDGSVWRTVACMVPDVVDVAGAAHWYHFNFSTVVPDEQPTTVYRTTARRSARLNTDSGAGVWRLDLPDLVPGRTYRATTWVKRLTGDGSASSRVCDLEISRPTTPGNYASTVIQANTHFDDWTLLTGTFVAPAAGWAPAALQMQGSAGVFLSGGWNVYVSDWDVIDIT